MFLPMRDETQQISDPRIDPSHGTSERDRLQMSDVAALAQRNHARLPVTFSIECKDQGALKRRQEKCAGRVSHVVIYCDHSGRSLCQFPLQAAHARPLPAEPGEFSSFIVTSRERSEGGDPSAGKGAPGPAAEWTGRHSDYVHVTAESFRFLQAKCDRRFRHTPSCGWSQLFVLDSGLDYTVTKKRCRCVALEGGNAKNQHARPPDGPHDNNGGVCTEESSDASRDTSW